ncbi:hypothetical protein [Streptomyces fagopyri]|uniref:hypothetical protein n=1 Tax=Streptomyces fagopyri TaxID=2662397 RepID=UPI0037120C6B
MIDIKHWTKQATRIGQDHEYTHASLARDLVHTLGWTTATDIACALRSYVYGSPGRTELHTVVRPLYDVLGWQQSALVACWFRDASNRPGTKKPPQKRPGGWPTATR